MAIDMDRPSPPNFDLTGATTDVLTGDVVDGRAEETNEGELLDCADGKLGREMLSGMGGGRD